MHQHGHSRSRTIRLLIMAIHTSIIVFVFIATGTYSTFHVVAIPMYERHTALNMYELISTVLNVLCPRWRSKLIGLGSDGAPNMTGKDGGVVTLFEQEAEHQIYHVWCGLHQLDLVMKAAYNTLFDGEVLSIMTALITPI